ncbi:hypothetical protein CASFOL_033180 [Castilleja foliolosa]|uniref:Uncharacterized protein n=1 Tax=Castilleja foliolosa TaxID=1961234 RepID=A0ABD3C4J8_9LAMI
MANPSHFPAIGELFAGDVPNRHRVNDGVANLDYGEAIVRHHRSGVVTIPGINQQLTNIQQTLVKMNNQLDRIGTHLATKNARAALAAAKDFNSKITARTRDVVDYLRIPKLVAGHPIVEPPHIPNINMQPAYLIGDLPPENLVPRNDAAFTALKSQRQNLTKLRTRVRRIQWFYNDPLLEPALNDNPSRDDCRVFLDTLLKYIKS